ERLLVGPKATQRLVVTATLSAGSTEDVTGKAIYSTNDDSVAVVSREGLVTAKAPGETAIMIRHLGQVAVARIAVLPAAAPPSWPDPQAGAPPARRNFIDRIVFDKLRKLRVPPSNLCTDEEFIRRASLDTIGMIPTPEEVRNFLADRDP